MTGGTDRIYLRVDPSSPVMDVIKAAIQTAAAFHRASSEFKARHNAAEVVLQGQECVAGLIFPESDAPYGWRRRNGYCVPNLRCKIGQQLAREMKSLPEGVDAQKFSLMLSGRFGSTFTHWDGSSVAFTVYERYGDVFVLDVPEPCNADLPGCVRLKMSEYWQIREAAEEDVARMLFGGRGNLGRKKFESTVI